MQNSLGNSADVSARWTTHSVLHYCKAMPLIFTWRQSESRICSCNTAWCLRFTHCVTIVARRASLCTHLRCYAMTACRKEARCQPNFRQHVVPKASDSCGPYQPVEEGFSDRSPTPAEDPAQRGWPSSGNHDTIAMVAIDADGHIAAGASSNGASHKVQQYSCVYCKVV